MKSFATVLVPIMFIFLRLISPETSEAFFREGVSYAVNSPRSIATEDFNEDGHLDLAVASRSLGSNVFILTGSAHGTFTVAGSFGSGIASNTCIIAGDFNKDKHLDLAVTEYEHDFGGNADLLILLGNGDGSFQDATPYYAGQHPESITTADFDKDGNLDLAVASKDYWAVLFYRGNGDGSFQQGQTIFSIVGPNFVTATDLNGDTYPDIAVASPEKRNDEYVIYILLGNGDGTFQNATYYPAGGRSFCIAFGDFNGDTKVDLAVANYDSNNVCVLLGNGDGTFATPVAYPVGTDPIAITAEDFDGDTSLDFVVANFGSTSISVLRGKGDGNFVGAVTYEVGQAPASTDTGDFNRDGYVDLAVANYDSNDVSILINTGHPSDSGPCFIEAVAF